MSFDRLTSGLLKASHLPSGDQAGRPMLPYFEAASSLRSLPSAVIVQSLPSEVVKAIDFESGDQM